jgi:hypothetical protein
MKQVVGTSFLTTCLSATKSRYPPIQKEKGYVRLLAYRNKTIEKLNVHIRIGLYGEKPKKIGELLINNGGYSVETVTGKEQQIIMNGELFKVRSATQL